MARHQSILTQVELHGIRVGLMLATWCGMFRKSARSGPIDNWHSQHPPDHDPLHVGTTRIRWQGKVCLIVFISVVVHKHQLTPTSSYS